MAMKEEQVFTGKFVIVEDNKVVAYWSNTIQNLEHLESEIYLEDLQSQGFFKDKKDNLVLGKDFVEFRNGFNGAVGTEISFYNRYGKEISLEEKISKGFIVLEDNQVYDVEKDEIREKTDIERYKDDPSAEEFKLQTVETDKQGNEYLSEYSELEKFEKQLISAEEYDKFIDNQRENAYRNETDSIQSKINFDKGLDKNEVKFLEDSIVAKKEAIKKQYPKSKEIVENNESKKI